MHVPARVIRPHLAWLASSPVPTEHGTFELHVFSDTSTAEEKEHVAMVYGDIRGGDDVPVRVHSECMTSEVFGSLKCDCKDQLEHAMGEIARRGAGAVVYLRQEGRGIGLANKIRAYGLQAEGHDTVDANRMLGLPDDARKYDIAADLLGFFGVKSVQLLTNNPAKVSALRALGVEVHGRLPVVVQPNRFSHGYLEAKRLRMSHELPPFAMPARAANGDAE